MEEERYDCVVCLDDKSYKGCYACADEDYTEEDKEAYISIPIDHPGYSYYGRLSDVQPTVGVIYQMLDMHIEKMVNKHGNRFIIDMKKILSAHRKSLKEMIDKVAKSNSFNASEIRDVKKRVNEQDKFILKTKSILKAREPDKEEEEEMAKIKAVLIKKGVIKDKKESDF